MSTRCLQAFYLPATKHLWWWLGIRSISKASFKQLLQQGNSVVLVPGGVSECMIMETGMHSSFTSLSLRILVKGLSRRSRSTCVGESMIKETSMHLSSEMVTRLACFSML